MNRYPLGSAPVLRAAFTDENGQDAEPTTVTLTVTTPAGVATTYTAGQMTNDGVGRWSKEITASALGTWTYAFTGTGAVVATRTGRFAVASTVTAPSSGDTCTPWATLGDLCSPCDDYGMDTVALETWLQVASDNLYNLTGRRWPGECEATERPCGTGSCFIGPGTSWPHREVRLSCACVGLSRIALEGYPVTEILEVKVDGVLVDPSEYEIQGRRYLVGLRLGATSSVTSVLDGGGAWAVPTATVDGGDANDIPGAIIDGGGADAVATVTTATGPSTELRVWPNCQHLERPDTEEGTFSVRYLYGANPPPGGIAAAASLGCQLALSCQPDSGGSGSARCRLPKRVTTITRQGVTLAVIDTFSLFKDGLTGLAEVDLWIESVRQGDKRRRASMSDPGRRMSSPGLLRR